MYSIRKNFCNQGNRHTFLAALLSLTCFCLLLPGLAEARPPTERIINGTDSPLGSGNDSAYPWMASLQFDGSHFCGGVLVSPQYVLTAAHCVDLLVAPIMRYDPNALNRLQVVLGARDIMQAGGVVSEIKGGIINPLYDSYLIKNDVALIKLAQPVSVTPIPVASEDDTSLYTPLSTVRLLGWGIKNSAGVLPGVLQQGDIPLRSEAVCQDNLGQYLFSDSMICAGTLSSTVNGINQQDGVDACNGDSGGPLLASLGGGQFSVIGLTSFGLGTCASDKTYGVYAKVAPFYDFIMSTPQVTPLNYTRPSVTGSPELGRRLVCSGDRWVGEPGEYTIRWLRAPKDGSALPQTITGATSRSYRVTRADFGYSITCEVTSSNSGGSASAEPFDGVFVPIPDTGPIAPAFGGISCTNKTCTITVLEEDLSSDYKKVSGSIKSSLKRRTGFGNTRTANATPGSGAGWTFTIKRPTKRYFSLTAVAIDYQDRVSTPARFLFEISPDRSTFEKVG